MQMGPEYSLLAVFFFAILAASQWRRRRVRRAVRDLPTALRRKLGPDPFYEVPVPVPDGLEDFAALQARVDRTVYVIWGLGFLYLAYVGFVLLGTV